MKIIGATADGLLLSATKDEVSNLCGFYSHYERSSQGHGELCPGVEIKVNELFKVAYERESRRRDLNSVITYLRGLADYLEPVTAVVWVDGKKEGGP